MSIYFIDRIKSGGHFKLYLGAPHPPLNAVNRGIAIEGFGCLLAGLWGSGNGTTSYAENTGIIAITKVKSSFAFSACIISVESISIRVSRSTPTFT